MKNIRRSVSSLATNLTYRVLDAALLAFIGATSGSAEALDPGHSDGTGPQSTSGETVPASTPPAAPTPTAQPEVAHLAVPIMPAVPAGYALTIAPQPGVVVYVPPAWVLPTDTTRRALNAVYFEFGGNALVYSVNYERFLTQDISARVGLGYLSVGGAASTDGASASLTSVPLMVNYLGVGRLNHRLEIGAGLVVLHLSARTSDGIGSSFGSGVLAAGTGTVAYRYAPLDGGFNFKAGFTPLLSTFGIYPSFGVGLGAVF